MKDLAYLERDRVKFYLVTSDNMFIHLNGDRIEKTSQIEDATSYYTEYDAVSLYLRCIKLCIKCRIIKYDIKYKPVDTVNVKEET